MTIKVADIEAGWIFRTAQDQERLVLGHDRHGNIVSSVRGGNKGNPFEEHRACSAESFAEAVVEKVKEVPDLEPFIEANHARDILA